LAPKERRGAVENTKLFSFRVEKDCLVLERSHLNGRAPLIKKTCHGTPSKPTV
jgi:hypothetical protein